MIFASCGAVKLEKNLALTRQRMFLFADDVAAPTALSTLGSVVKTINKARSFSRLVKDSAMVCTRMAGWKSNKYYYTTVPNVSWNGTAPQASASEALTPYAMFARYYSIGIALSGSAPTGFTGSILEFDGGDQTPYPPRATMLLPCYDDTVAEASFTVKTATISNVAVTLSAASSGNIGTIGNYTSNTSSQLSTVRMNQTNLTDISAASIPLNLDYAGAAAIAANTQTVGSTAAVAGTINGPRILYGSQTNVYGTKYFSGGDWVYNYTYTAGTYGTSYNVDEANRLYGVCSHADTAAYKIVFGMMPVLMDIKAPCIVQILREGIDFVQSAVALPSAAPSITMNAISPIVINKTFSI